MINLGHLFAVAWQDLKKGATAAQSFITNHGAQIQADVKIGEGVVTTLDPSVTPFVTVFDSIEEALMGEVTAAVSSVATAPDPAGFFTVSLPATLWPALKGIGTTLSGHPAVVAATTPKA